MTNSSHKNKNKNEIEKIKKAKISSTRTNDGKPEGQPGDEENRMVAAVINGVTNALRHLASQSTPPISFPQNGRAISASSRRTNASSSSQATDDASTITFNHLGNPL